MYKVNADGSIECSTPEEALSLQRAILAAQPRKRIERPRPQPAYVRETLGKFRDYDGKILNSDDMVKIFEVESANGVGTKLRHVRNAFEKEGYNLDEYLVPVRGEDGVPKWNVRLHTTAPSA